MDTTRILVEVQRAKTQFPNIDTQTGAAGLTVRAVLKTSVGNAYIVELEFQDYPSRMPVVHVRAPQLAASPHRYKSGNICYLHPSMWNPGRHNITFVIARAAKWLNKYDVYSRTGLWMGAEVAH